MNKRRFHFLLPVFLFIISSAGYAMTQPEAGSKVITKPIEYKNAHWIFSGMVKNGRGESFGYFFKMQRQDNLFHVQAALLDGQSKQVILSYDKSKTIEKPKDLKWTVGQAFLFYNPVNSNWSFGVKDKQDKGFNFKLNMVEKPDEDQKTKTLRSGLDILVRQTSRLSGHLHKGTENSEQFVTANHTWYAKMWLSDKQKEAHKIKGLFCRMNNGSGFYAIKLKESDAVRAALAAWRDAEGNPVKMSQFVHIKKQQNDSWEVKNSLPKLDLQFKNLLAKNSEEKTDSAGFFKGAESGFCFLSRQIFSQEENKPTDSPKASKAE